MISQEDAPRDLAALAVPRAGGLHETGDPWEPYRLVDASGCAVVPVTAYLQDLQAAGRPAATQRSYAMDLLRWFRFCWAIGVPWDQATRAEARDFSCWVQLTAKPAPLRPGEHGEQAVSRSAGPPPGTPNPVTGKPAPGRRYATATVLHCETVLRGFYEYHLQAGTGPIVNPFVLARAGRMLTTTRWTRSARSRACSGRGRRGGSRGASPMRSSTSCSLRWAQTGIAPWWHSGSPLGRVPRNCSA